MSLNSPIISIDCKKKEQLGTLYRDGRCYTQSPIEVYDHDYSNLAIGKIIPYGIYDLAANEGYITIGNSAETAEFITDNYATNRAIIAYSYKSIKKRANFAVIKSHFCNATFTHGKDR